jgi:hypothetical protein
MRGPTLMNRRLKKYLDLGYADGSFTLKVAKVLA